MLTNPLAARCMLLPYLERLLRSWDLSCAPAATWEGGIAVWLARRACSQEQLALLALGKSCFLSLSFSL